LKHFFLNFEGAYLPLEKIKKEKKNRFGTEHFSRYLPKRTDISCLRWADSLFIFMGERREGKLIS